MDGERLADESAPNVMRGLRRRTDPGRYLHSRGQNERKNAADGAFRASTAGVDGSAGSAVGVVAKSDPRAGCMCGNLPTADRGVERT